MLIILFVYKSFIEVLSELGSAPYAFDVGIAVQTYTLHTKGSNNRFGEKMIQKSGPIIWNSIPECIQGAASITSFKHLLKTHIFHQYDLDNTVENIYRRNYTNNNINNRNNINND